MSIPDGTPPSSEEAADLLAGAERIHETTTAGFATAPWYGPAIAGGEALIFLGQMLPGLVPFPPVTGLTSLPVTLLAVVILTTATRKQIQLTGIRYRARDHRGLIAVLLGPLLTLFIASLTIEKATGHLWPWPLSALLVFVFLLLFIRRLDRKARTAGPSRPDPRTTDADPGDE